MSKFLRYAAVGAAVATLGLASGAQAATQDNAQVSATILTSLSVAVRTGDDTLDFASISPGAAAGVVTVAAADGSRTCDPAVICTGTTNAPTFDITGAPGATVYIRFDNTSVTLQDAASDTMTADSFVTDQASDTTTLDASGQKAFAVGGSLHVAAGQAAGSYTGQLGVNVAYN
jgi:hypothetical protein